MRSHRVHSYNIYTLIRTMREIVREIIKYKRQHAGLLRRTIPAIFFDHMGQFDDIFTFFVFLTGIERLFL